MIKKFNEYSLNESDKIKGPVELAYDKMKASMYSKTNQINDEIQDLYNKIRFLQDKEDKIKRSYDDENEALRKQAVLEEPNAGFLTKNDLVKYNPEKVNKSEDLRKQIISVILNKRQELDEDGIFKIIDKMRGEHNMDSDDISKIYRAVQDAGLYIAGM